MSLLDTPFTRAVGIDVPLGRRMLRGRRTRRLMRAWYAIRSARRLKRSVFRGDTSRDYRQAEMSVAGITSVASVATIIEDVRAALLTAGG